MDFSYKKQNDVKIKWESTCQKKEEKHVAPKLDKVWKVKRFYDYWGGYSVYTILLNKDFEVYYPSWKLSLSLVKYHICVYYVFYTSEMKYHFKIKQDLIK